MLGKVVEGRLRGASLARFLGARAVVEHHGLRPLRRGEEALTAKLLVAALSLAVRRQRQPPSLARLLETPDRVPAGLHRPRGYTSAPALSGMKISADRCVAQARSCLLLAMALKSWLQYLSLLLLLTAATTTAQPEGACFRSACQ